jgi:hypothetical protein
MLARSLAAPHLLSRTTAPVLVVDLDATFKRDLMANLPVLNKEDFGLLITEGGNHWNTIKAGLVWIRSTGNGFRFIRGVANYTSEVLGSGECCWTLDQSALWATQRHRASICPDIKIINLHATLYGTGHRVDIAKGLVTQMSVSSERSIDRSPRLGPRHLHATTKIPMPKG